MRVILAGLCLAAASSVAPASAADFALGASAPIQLDEYAGACVHVNAPGQFVGEFSAAGMVSGIIQDGVVVLSPIAGAEPLVGVNSTTACIPGAYGVRSISGYVVYTVTVTSVGGDYAQVMVCTFGGGRSCR